MLKIQPNETIVKKYPFLNNRRAARAFKKAYLTCLLIGEKRFTFKEKEFEMEDAKNILGSLNLVQLSTKAYPYPFTIIDSLCDSLNVRKVLKSELKKILRECYIPKKTYDRVEASSLKKDLIIKKLKKENRDFRSSFKLLKVA